MYHYKSFETVKVKKEADLVQQVIGFSDCSRFLSPGTSDEDARTFDSFFLHQSVLFECAIDASAKKDTRLFTLIVFPSRRFVPLGFAFAFLNWT